MPYIGNTAPNNFVSVVKDLFSGDGSTVAFTLSKAATTNGVAVFVENVRQEPTIAYAVSGTTLTFTAAPVSASGNNIYVLHHNAPASTATHPAAQALTATSGTFTSAVDISAKSSVDISSSGNAIDFKLSGTTIGNIGVISDRVYLTAEGSHGLYLDASADNICPSSTTGTDNDDAIDLGASSARFDDVFATNGTIQTSDQNEKQDIASATAKELNVAKKLSSLFKTFRWKSKVAEKGDNARTHTGIIAQEIESAFSAEGLDASNYGLFTSDTWVNEEGKSQTRLGVRYPELFSFIFSSIEARLTALEEA